MHYPTYGVRPLQLPTTADPSCCIGRQPPGNVVLDISWIQDDDLHIRHHHQPPLLLRLSRNMNFEEPPMSQVGWAVVYDVSPTRVNLAKILGKVAALEWPGCPTALENLTT